MQQTKRPLFALALALWALSSCSQDASDVQGSATGGETVTLSLSAEVSVDDPSLRAIDYKLGTNAKGQLVPMPQFEDKQIVEVHTILKSSRSGSVPVAKTLKWRYDASKKKLVLAPLHSDITKDDNNIVIPDFNTDGGTKLYISGLIGGTLSGTQVTFQGTRELQGASSAGDAVGSLEVPYAFPWTELTIDSKSTKDSNGSYKSAEVPSTANLKFAPQGALIAYKLGNKQKAGTYTFTPSGFTVSSNAFGDQGTFELNTALPTQSTETVFPTWTEGTLSALVYRFAGGQEPGTLQHEAVASKTYYAWVMPHKTQPTAVTTRVMIKGESSRSATEGFKDYTKTWFTDYAPKASQLTSGRVHQLSANATHRVTLPIEYVTDYDLLGGDGLAHSPFGSNAGPLRFADGHQSVEGYNWFKLMGLYDRTRNPDTRSLQAEVDKVFGDNKYYVPSIDQWWGIWPSNASYIWTTQRELRDRNEPMAFGSYDNLIRQSYRSDYSRAFSTDNTTQDAYIYAIRFKRRPAGTMRVAWEYKEGSNTLQFVSYPSALDDLFKCAYRFRRVGLSDRAEVAGLIVDVVYLGEELTPTSLEQVSTDQWWADKNAKEEVNSRIFSVEIINNPNQVVKYWSSSRSRSNSAWNVAFNKVEVHTIEEHDHSNPLRVRLFVRQHQ